MTLGPRELDEGDVIEGVGTEGRRSQRRTGQRGVEDEIIVGPLPLVEDDAPCPLDRRDGVTLENTRARPANQPEHAADDPDEDHHRPQTRGAERHSWRSNPRNRDGGSVHGRSMTGRPRPGNGTSKVDKCE